MLEGLSSDFKKHIKSYDSALSKDGVDGFPGLLVTAPDSKEVLISEVYC